MDDVLFEQVGKCLKTIEQKAKENYTLEEIKELFAQMYDYFGDKIDWLNIQFKPESSEKIKENFMMISEFSKEDIKKQTIDYLSKKVFDKQTIDLIYGYGPRPYKPLVNFQDCNYKDTYDEEKYEQLKEIIHEFCISCKDKFCFSKNCEIISLMYYNLKDVNNL